MEEALDEELDLLEEKADHTRGHPGLRRSGRATDWTTVTRREIAYLIAGQFQEIHLLLLLLLDGFNRRRSVVRALQTLLFYPD